MSFQLSVTLDQELSELVRQKAAQDGVSPDEFVEAALAEAVGRPDIRRVTVHAPSGLAGARAVREPGQSDESFAKSEDIVSLLTGHASKAIKE